MIDHKNLINLRTIQDQDAEVLMELNNNKEIAAYIVGTPKTVTLEEQKKWMENLQYEKKTKRWMIEYCEKIVGTVILSNIDQSNGVGNMNIKLLPEFQGKGIANAALKKACNFAFDELGMYCLTAHILPFNIKSQRLFKSAGFREEGVLRSRIVKNQTRHDLLSLSLIKPERT